MAGIVDGRPRTNLQVPGEELLAQLVGSSDAAERGVEDGDTVTEPLGLLETVRGQEDRHAPVLEPYDELVDLSGGDGVKSRGGFVQEQH